MSGVERQFQRAGLKKFIKEQRDKRWAVVAEDLKTLNQRLNVIEVALLQRKILARVTEAGVILASGEDLQRPEEKGSKVIRP